jgi:hypothetical protein
LHEQTKTKQGEIIMAKMTKKSTAKKPVAKKATAKAKPKTKTPSTRTTKAKGSTAGSTRGSTATLKLPRATGKPTTRRPPNTPSIPQTVLDAVNSDLNSVKNYLADYAEHLRSLDRKRLNGVGLKRLGFIEACYEVALENPEYLPHYVTLEKWTADHELFIYIRSLKLLSEQVTELLKNMEITAADIDYTNALEYYTPIKEAAKRRVDGAESLYKVLEIFYKRQKSPNAHETLKQFLRDAKAIYKGKKDGIVEAKNISPKLSGGIHKVIDEYIKDSGKFQEDISVNNEE